MMKIRRCVVGDEEALRRICRDTTLRVNVKEYGAELVGKWVSRLEDAAKWEMRTRRNNPFVAECEGSLVGFVELTGAGRISAFYCHHEWQRRGVGAALYQALETEALRLRMDALEVDSSVSASGFFEARGFQTITEKVTVTDGVPSRSLLMRKRLQDRRAPPPSANPLHGSS